MRRRSVLLLVACVAIAGATGGQTVVVATADGASSATTASLPAPQYLRVPGLGRAQRIEGFGHSYVGGVGVDPGQGVLPLVGNQLRVAGGDSPKGARTVIDSLISVYESNLRRDAGPEAQVGLVMLGLNDLAQFGPGLAGYSNGLESLISRIRTGIGDAHPSADPTVTLGGGAAAWSYGPLYRYVTANAALDIDVSAYKAGGTLGFVAPAGQGTGAVYRFTVDGKAAGALDTRGLFPTAPASPEGYTPFVGRVPIRRNARTLHVEITDVQGQAGFYGWQMEARTPPLIVVLHQPRLPDYGSYANYFHTPTDADVAALNQAIDVVAARFGDGLVVTADADGAIGADPAFFQDDRLHPNATGHRELARAAEAALRAAAR